MTDLYSHVAHDGPLVTLQSFLCNSPYIILALAKKLLTRSLQHLVVLTLDLHLWKQFSPQIKEVNNTSVRVKVILQQQQPLIYSHYTGQSALASNSS